VETFQRRIHHDAALSNNTICNRGEGMTIRCVKYSYVDEYGREFRKLKLLKDTCFGYCVMRNEVWPVENETAMFVEVPVNAI
jgi:hypothetical protein